MDTITTKDERGNITFGRDSDGEYWQEFDENNNKIYHKNSEGYEIWREYDENHHVIHSIDSYGYELWREFDDQDRLITCKDNKGYHKWYEYMEGGRIEYFQRNGGDIDIYYNTIDAKKVLNSIGIET